VKKVTYIIGIPSIAAIAIYSIFIIIFRYKSIIYNAGIIKILIFSFALIMYFLSNFFTTYRNYFQCSVYFIIKHIGLSIIFVVLHIYLILNLKLGIKRNKKQFSFIGQYNDSSYFESEAPNTNNNINESQNFVKNNNKAIIKGNKSLLSLRSYRKESKDNATSTSLIDEDNIHFGKKIKRIHSTIMEILFLHFIFIVVIFMFIIFYWKKNKNNEDNNIYHSKNGEFIYKCPLGQADLVMNFLYFLLIIFLYITGKSVIKYECIFKYIQYIVYSTYSLIVVGPIVNVNLKYVFLLLIIIIIIIDIRVIINIFEY